MTDEVTPEGREAMASALAAVTASMANSGRGSLTQFSVRQLSLEMASLVAIVRLLVDELARETRQDAEQIWATFCVTSAASLMDDSK